MIQRKTIEQLAFFGGLTAIAFEWLAVLFFYFYSPATFGKDQPLSYYATLPQTRLVFVTCLSIAAISFWIFVTYHLSKHLKTPVTLFSFSMLSYLATAIIPFQMDNGWSENIHRLLTLSFSLSFILGIYFMGKYNESKKFKLLSFTTAFTTITVTIIMFLIPNKSIFFILELLSAFICQLWMIATTYYTYKLKMKK